MFWFHLIFAGLAGYLGYHFGADIKLSEQWPYFEALRTTTSIVFGVMGALLALIYPEVLKPAMRDVSSLSGDGNLRRVLLPCASSAVLLIGLVMLAPIFAWINVATSKEAESIAQQAMFALFCILSYWQIVILQMVLLPMESLLANTTIAAARSRLIRSIHTNGRG